MKKSDGLFDPLLPESRIATILGARRSSKLPPNRIKRISAILDLIEAATSPEDLNLPGFGFHRLSGKSKGRRFRDSQLGYHVRLARRRRGGCRF